MSIPTSPDAARMVALIERFSGRRVVVLGDMVADEYIHGTPVRISREAPVVVLEYARRDLVPGGATNVAVNLRALGADVAVVGVVGADRHGQELAERLEAMGIDTAGLVVDPDRPTSTKTRIIGGGAQVVQQQLVRIDRVSDAPLASAPKARLLRAAEASLRGAEALILSDYEHGVIEPELIARCLPGAVAAGLVTTVDAHGGLYRFQGVTLATPNQPEAEAALGRELHDIAALRAGGAELLAGMHGHGLLLTRGGLGMAVFDREGLFEQLPAYSQVEVRDATGAGDTVAAVATLVLAAGGSLLDAATTANVAAGLVVRRFGAASVTPEELAEAVAALIGAGEAWH